MADGRRSASRGAEPPSGDRTRTRGFFGWVRAVDDGVFAVEQAIVALALIAITVLMFVNVLARRIQAQDSKVGAVLAKIARISDLETRAWIDANVAPWVTLVGSFALVVFGYYSWRRFVAKRKRAPLPALGPALAVGAGVAAIVVAAGWGFARVFVTLEAPIIFAGLFGAAAAAYVAHAIVKRPSSWELKAAAGAIGGAGVVWFCLAWFPIGYTWTNKVSLMLLLWVGLLGTSVCVHAGKHIRIEALGKLAPEVSRRYVVALGFLGTAAFCAVMTWLGVLYTFEPTASDDPSMPELFTVFGTRYVFGFTGAYGLEGRIEGTDIPDWIGTLSVIVGFGLATLRFLGASVSSALGGDYGAAAPQEGLEEAKQHAGGGSGAADEESAARHGASDADEREPDPRAVLGARASEDDESEDDEREDDEREDDEREDDEREDDERDGGRADDGETDESDADEEESR